MEPKTESNENVKQKPMSPEETATVGVVRESDSLKWEGFVIRVDRRHGTGSLGHRVNGSFGLSFTSGYRVVILTRWETRVLPVFHCKRLSHNYGINIALPGAMQILLFGAGYKYSYLLA